MKNIPIYLFLVLILLSFFSCQENNETPSKSSSNSNTKLFKDLDATSTGLSFNNEIIETQSVNYYRYVYLYNGGGVGIGDLNNDDLPEIYFTSTTGKDKLFLNKGNMQFEDISQTAEINKYGGQKTGVTMVDINNDGLLDVYVSRAGWDTNAETRRNLLFINKGNNQFEEQAAKWKINDIGHTSQSAFFDYDNDGDLDLFVANHPGEFSQPITSMVEKMKNPNPNISSKLYRNNGNNTFTDVSINAGILAYCYSLGLAIGDLNQDGWQDIYVTSDFAPHDFYYINNGDGTFTESLKEFFPHCSYFAMGCDLVDINQDKNLDLFVVEMLSEDNVRQKTNMAPMDMGRFSYMVSNDMHFQYMRNSFQINNGNGHFSDVAHYSGIDKTDWSWGTLFGDYDNDGDDDLLVVNGFLHDTQDKDFTDRSNKLAQSSPGRLSFEQVYSLLESTPIKNYSYKNNGNLKFENTADDWGFNFEGFSNGISYGDLDRDGDLDVVVNNINADASVYENTTNSKNYIAFTLEGSPQNRTGLQTEITLHTQERMQYKAFQLTRGFQSSVDPIIHFGLKPNEVVEKVEVVWPDGKMQEISNLTTGKYHQLKYGDAQNSVDKQQLVNAPFFRDISQNSSLQFKHEDDYYDDYKREVLLPHQLSQLGPAIAVGDVDNNGLEDCYIGGANGHSGACYLQQSAGKFIKSSPKTWQTDAAYEDIDALFFDADGDADLDLYVVSGSNQYEAGSVLLQDRFYENKGNGNFVRNKKAIPNSNISGGCVIAGDYDTDGDLDLFVGGRLIPGDYPQSPGSYILQNNQGSFTNVTAEIAPELQQAGMVTAAIWNDFNSDGHLDLVTVGEWTGILFYENKAGNFTQSATQNDHSDQVGWWNCIKAADLDGDGDQDFVVGNLGLNYKYQATDSKPFEIYSNDFDGNGQRDIVLGYYSGENLYPVRGLQCSSEQIPGIKKDFPTYKEFGTASLTEIYGDGLKDAIHYAANNFSSVVLWNDGEGKYTRKALPYQAQLAPIQDLLFQDVNQDGQLDIILAGNLFVAEIETPRADNGTGLILQNKGNQNFEVLSINQSGFFANKDLRHMAWIDCGKDQAPLLVTANSNAKIQVFERSK